MFPLPLYKRGDQAATILAEANDWWLSGDIAAANCIAAYQPKGADDLADSYINLADPGTNNATAPVAAPTFNATTGWTFNGSTQYLLAGSIVGTNSQSCVIRFSGGSKQTDAMFGVNFFTGSKVRFHIYPYYSDNNAYFRAGGTYNTSGVNYSSGVLAVTPAKAYANGSPLDVLASAWIGSSTEVIVMGGCSYDATVCAEFWAGNILAIAFYDITLSDAQVAAITTEMAAL